MVIEKEKKHIKVKFLMCRQCLIIPFTSTSSCVSFKYPSVDSRFPKSDKDDAYTVVDGQRKPADLHPDGDLGIDTDEDGLVYLHGGQVRRNQEDGMFLKFIIYV